MKIKRRLALWLLFSFLHSVLTPLMGIANGHDTALHGLLTPMCGEAASIVEVNISDNQPPSLEHDGFCLLCCCPSTPAELDNAYAGLGCLAADSVPAAANAALTRISLWLPVLPRAPPAFS